MSSSHSATVFLLLVSMAIIPFSVLLAVLPVQKLWLSYRAVMRSQPLALELFSIVSPQAKGQ
jgi:hypothetical protein